MKKVPVQTAGGQVSTNLSQQGPGQVLVLDFMEEGEELLEDLLTQSADTNV